MARRDVTSIIGMIHKMLDGMAPLVTLFYPVEEERGYLTLLRRE